LIPIHVAQDLVAGGSYLIDATGVPFQRQQPRLAGLDPQEALVTGSFRATKFGTNGENESLKYRPNGQPVKPSVPNETPAFQGSDGGTETHTRRRNLISVVANRSQLAVVSKPNIHFPVTILEFNVIGVDTRGGRAHK
jgi:hypothetical protein